MKKKIIMLLGIATMLFSVISLLGQTSTKMIVKRVLPITTKSKAAKDLADKGTNYFLNIEFPQAYQYFSEAVKLDPDFTYAQVFMSFLTTGEVSKDFAAKAIKTSKNKTEGEKLFASIADQKLTPEANREIWNKLYKMYPDCNLIENYYAATRATPEESVVAYENYIKKYPKDGWMYNNLGYYYMNSKKDMVMAKQNFEKYIALYPKGCNPYDSMGDYYKTAGDMDNAEKMYTKALESYPFFTSSINSLTQIKKDKEAAKEKAVN